MHPRQRLHQLGLRLPRAARPAGRYAATVVAGGFLHVSGQFPFRGGRLLHTGRVGGELTVAEGRAAARQAALNVLAQIHAALGGFERLAGLVRVEGHVASAPGWVDAPAVLDAASTVFTTVLGARGRHARTAFTPPVLPLNSPVELVVTAVVRAKP